MLEVRARPSAATPSTAGSWRPATLKLGAGRIEIDGGKGAEVLVFDLP